MSKVRKYAISAGAVLGALALGVASAYAALTIGSVLISTDGNVSINGIAASIYAIGTSTTSGTITIGGEAQTGALTVGQSSGQNTVNIGTGAGSTTLNLVTGAGVNTVNIGGLIYATSTPTPVIAADSYAGAASVVGSDVVGVITSVATAHTSSSITFGTVHATAPVCFVQPTNVAAGGVASSTFVTAATTGLKITHASITAAATWNYLCIGK
jgi:hypothetical protein